MMELGQTSDPVDLVAGSVAGIDEFTARWRARARIADSIATRLRRLEAPSGWEGTAAAGFASRLPTAFAQWEQLSQSLTTAADASDQYATVLGWAQHRTPIAGLYLCGAGTHPGGGVTGAPGAHAARVVLRDAGRS